MSSSFLIITKSTGKMNFPTLISTSSRTPSGCAIDLSAIYNVIVVGVSSPKLSLRTTDRGIKFILAPESHKAFLNSYFPMEQGMVKLPGSFIFSGSFLMDNCTAGSSQIHYSFLGYFPFLIQHLLHKFCISRHLVHYLCKWDIDFYLLEDVQESRKLLFPFCLLKPLGEWHGRCISWYSLLLFLLTASFRLFSLYAILSFFSSFFLFCISLFFPFFLVVVTHFFPTS